MQRVETMQIGHMGTVISLVTNLVNRLREGELFTTRDLMGLGSRSAIDNATHTLVKRDVIVRVARGVFAKTPLTVPHSPYTVARFKAESFGKKIFEHPSVAAERILHIPWAKDPSVRVYGTNGGSSSSFQYGDLRIRLKVMSERKRQLVGSEVANLLSALWFLGRRFVTPELIGAKIQKWTYVEVMQVTKLAASAPNWLISLFKTHQNTAYKEVERKWDLDKVPPPLKSTANYEDYLEFEDIFEDKIPFWDVTGAPIPWEEAPVIVCLR